VIRLTLLIPTLDRSGAEKQLALLATHLPRKTFDVEVVALDRGGAYEELLRQQDVPVTVLGKRFKFDPAALWRLRAHLRDRRPDILHTWLFSANGYGRLVRGASAATKVVVSERCVDSWKAGWQLWLDRRLASRTDRMVANSQSVADFYREHGFPAERIVVIPNAVEPPFPAPLTRDELLQQLELPPNAKLVGYVGRLARQKRIDDLLWAAQVLRQADERAYFLIIGDGPERDRLVRHARDVECAAHVRFLGHREDAASLLHLLDVFWLASDFEGMSNSLMEAMTCGLPVLASNIPPNREVAQHGVHGYLIDVGDGAGYAQYTVKLFREPELARQLGAAGRHRMATEFGVERMVTAYADLYANLGDRGQESGFRSQERKATLPLIPDP
jgi:glycosyltransferase involved in cell wall biosynthesis